ncbi:HlyD family secretion protein [Hoeflea prorocentri]|uniref:HlyD family secretion protein n=1 Tax=Hoeflea prorocentri TaxID=1922333 RepID=A0A9X3UGA1_9HYPH|nr:HlyD family secretion protein [Hoeflea prorocentri]MCY6380243.1 HlyD family secretion protein [Hoeflea prorocentri]MDA5398043.1 HlyD family secretion protein [Hoeflea prorocentri]
MNAEIKTQSADEAGAQSTSRLREFLIVVGALAIGGVLLFGIYLYWNFERDHPATANAFINANYIWVSPQIDGQVAQVFVEDNQAVKAGDKLFQLDPSLYQAQLKAAEASLVLVHQEIEAGKAKVAAAKAQVAEQQTAVDTAKSLSDSTKPLVRDGVEPVLKGIEIENSLVAARSKLATLQADLTVAEREYGTPEVIQAKIDNAEATLAEARLNLEWTNIVAPADGYVTNLTLRQGDVVSSGDDLFPFIESQKWWVDANFKETNVERIQPGQPVKITIDMYGDKEFTGVVESIGFSSAASFSLLPAQNTTGNWVKVTQRIPVRIALDTIDPAYPYRIGTSVSVEVNTDPPTGASGQ